MLARVRRNISSIRTFASLISSSPYDSLKAQIISTYREPTRLDDTRQRGSFFHRKQSLCGKSNKNTLRHSQRVNRTTWLLHLEGPRDRWDDSSSDRLFRVQTLIAHNYSLLSQPEGISLLRIIQKISPFHWQSTTGITLLFSLSPSFFFFSLIIAHRYRWFFDFDVSW